VSSGHRAWGPNIAEAWSQETGPPQGGNLIEETLWRLSFLLTEQKFEIHTDFVHFWTDFSGQIEKPYQKRSVLDRFFTARMKIGKETVKKR
jgi:hypothetical protein